MLRRALDDVVYVVLPNSMHAEFTVRAAKAGKHVICEKPMANTPQECEEMIAACKAANRKLMIGYRLRYEPYNMRAIEICRTKEFGAPRIIESNHSFNIGPNEWRTEDGSGLARNDLVSAQLLARVLQQQYQSRGDTALDLLPAGGAEGTLDHRLCCITDGRGVWAKTGTLNRAIALSGYARNAQGTMAFSILVNNFSAAAGEVRQWVDKIAVALLE